MLVNKYSIGRRMLYGLYRLFPRARLLKRLSLPMKIRKLQGITEARRLELTGSKNAVGRHPLFSHVEIETLNRCNGECDFCPVNRHLDPRPALRMTDELFHSIIDQLHALDYEGNLYPYSNNEPLLDTRIFDFLAYARKRLPRTRLYIYTNGLLLTPEKFLRLIPLVDRFTINDYTDDFVLHENIREIHDLAMANPEYGDKVQVTLRYRHEIMTSRGGQSPNKQDILPKTLPVGCLLPARQVIIRPDGKLSLCCNDALGKMTLGDLTREKLADIWWGETYSNLRMKVLQSREALDLCRHCDTLHF